MKRINFFILLLAVFMNDIPTSAQSSFSVRVGTNLGYWKTTVKGIKIYPNQNNGYKVYPIISVPFDFNLSKHWAIQADPSFIQKGTEIDYVKDNKTYEGCRLSVSYGEVPIFVKYFFLNPKKGFNLFLGPSFGIALGGKIKRGNNPLYQGTQINDALKFNIVGYPEREISFMVGLGNQFGRRGFDVRYSWGLTNLGIDKVGYAKFYNRGFHIAYIYNLWQDQKYL